MRDSLNSHSNTLVKLNKNGEREININDVKIDQLQMLIGQDITLRLKDDSSNNAWSEWAGRKKAGFKDYGDINLDCRRPKGRISLKTQGRKQQSRKSNIIQLGLIQTESPAYKGLKPAAQTRRSKDKARKQMLNTSQAALTNTTLPATFADFNRVQSSNGPHLKKSISNTKSESPKDANTDRSNGSRAFVDSNASTNKNRRSDIRPHSTLASFLMRD